MVSNLTGRVADEHTYADPTYWSRHCRSPVRFAESVQALVERGCDAFLEIGPSPTLIGMAQRCLPEGSYAWLPSLRPGRDDWQTLLDSLAQLYVRGAKVDWAGFDRDYPQRKTELPAYPFQRRRFWSNGADDAPRHGSFAPQRNGRVLNPLLGCRLAVAAKEQIFEAQIAANRPAMLADHQVQGLTLMPAAGYLEIVLAASAARDGKPWQPSGLTLAEPLLLDKTPRTIQTVLSPEGAGAASFRIVGMTEAANDAAPSFVTLATGRLESPREAAAETIDLALERSRFAGTPYDEVGQIELLRRSGFELGPAFRWLARLWVGKNEGLAELRPAEQGDHADDYQMHPGLLQSGFQLLGSILPGAGQDNDTYVPMGVDHVRLYDRPHTAAWCQAWLRSLKGKVAVGDIQFVDDSGRVLVRLEGVRLRRVPRDWLARCQAGPLPDWCYELAWTAQPLDSAASEPKAGEPGQWLVFDSPDGLGAAVAERLEMKAHRASLVPADADPEARRAAVQQFLAATGPGRRGVAYLSSLEVDGRSTAPDFAAARQRGWGGVLDVLHVLAESGGSEPPRLWLVTRGAQAVGHRPSPLSLTQSPLWGLGRVIASEHPALACTRVDLDPEDGHDAADQLVEELLWGQGEDQIAYRDAERWVARLQRLGHAETDGLETTDGQPYRLEITSRGQLNNVELRTMVRQSPGPGQVEIRVRATGLNFRDVLNLLDMYPGDAGPLGGECAGEVAAVGPGVEHFKLGDRVIALAPASFATYVITKAEFVAPMPAHLVFDEAATIPICFSTAELALRRLAQLQPGERVLIHCAAGGVGLAAIQVARAMGAEIFATAGSPRKREYLRSLGIEHVMDSRSLDFADQIRQQTGGEGIDVVLNSLAGEAIAASLSLLRAGGRFLELGKTDLWDQRQVDEIRPGVRFFAIALDQMMATEPESVRQLLGEVLPRFVEKKLDPLPLRAFRMDRTIDALRHMARAEHIGKVVVRAAAHGDSTDRGVSLREDGTYLVTGGLGGLGLKVAEWLANRGARHLVLVGRSGASPQAQSQLEALEKTGVRVAVRRCDVGNREAVAGLLSDIRETMPPLRGIFHLAGVLDDGVLGEQTRERFDRVMGAKMLGAWYLHELTQAERLDWFVLFSSAAALLGSPGQGNYASANAFLDALAQHRRWQRQPALSVNWGSWAEVGMAARLIETEGQRWASAGVGWIEPDRGLHTLERLMADDRTQAGVLPIDWPKFFARIPAGSEPAWLAELAREARTAVTPDAARPVLLDELQSVTPAERLDLALDHIRKQAARVLAIDEANLPDPRRTLNELGFDSLTAVEFANRVGRSIGQHLSPSLLFDYPTLESLTRHLVCDVLQLQSTVAPPAEASEEAVEDDRVQVLTDVESMSEEDMDALVSQQLEQLQK